MAKEIIIADSENLGQEIRELETGTEFTYKSCVGNFPCIKMSDKYVASRNGRDELIIFDVYENCLSLGTSNPRNFYAVQRMMRGLRVNN